MKLTLRADRTVQSISVHQEALLLAAAMSFQHVDRVDGIFGHTFAVHKLHSNGSVNHHVSEEVCVTEGPEVKVDKAAEEISFNHVQKM